MNPTMVPLMADSGSNSPARSNGGKKTLGRYEILERLFSKGGAETFRARVRGLAGFDRIFAVKCLRTQRHGSWTMNDPFLITARRSAAVLDPRLARVLEAVIIDGIAISVTEFIFGIDLERFLQCAEVSGDLSTGSDEPAFRWQKIVATIGSEVANGLTAAHALNPALIHGNLNLRNIFISSRASIKITDTGLYRAAMLTGDVPPLANSSYEAPEYRQPDSPISPAADVFSLGSILFQLVTGEPYLIDRDQDEAILTLNTLCPGLARDLWPLLEVDPGNRPSAKECAESLRNLAKSLSPVAVGPELVSLVRSYSVFSGDPSPETTEVNLPVLPPVSNSTFLTGGGADAKDTAIRPPLIPRPRAFEATIAPPALPQSPPPVPTPQGEMDKIVPIGKRRNPTIMSFPVLATPVPTNAPAQEAAPKPEPSRPTEFNDWAARALAALGDQAGIQVASVPLDSVPNFQPGSLTPFEEISIDESQAHLIPPPLTGEASVAMERSDIESSAFASVDPDLEVAWPEDIPQPSSLSRSIPDEEMNEFIDTPPLPLSIPITTLPLPPSADDATTNDPAGSLTRPPLAPRSAQRSAKRTGSDFPAMPEMGPATNRRKHLFLGILGVLCVGGIIGGGAGWLFSPPKRPPSRLNAIAAQSGTLNQGAPSQNHSQDRPLGVAAPSLLEKSVPRPALEKPPEPSIKPTVSLVTVAIQSTPTGAMVWLRGKERGKTPLTIKEQPGAANLVLVKEGFVSVKKTLPLAEGSRVEETLSAVTPPMVGDARFRAECITHGKYPIVVDGKETGILCPYSKMRVPPGVHRIGILIPSTGAIYEKEITLQKGVRSVSFSE